MSRTVLFVALALTACEGPTRDPYEDAVRDLLRDPERLTRDQARTIAKHWRRKRGITGVLPPREKIARYGLGPLPLEPEHVALHDKLLDVVSSSDFLVAESAAETIWYMQAPGHHDRLFRCAFSDSHVYLKCLDAVLTVANPESLAAIVPLVEEPHSRGARAASVLQELGLLGIPYLEQVLERGTAKGCSRAIVQFTATLEDADFFRHRDVGDPRVRPRVLAAVRKALFHPVASCREQAAVLVARNDETAAIWIGPLVVDPDPAVRQRVRDLLRKDPAAMKD